MIRFKNLRSKLLGMTALILSAFGAVVLYNVQHNVSNFEASEIESFQNNTRILNDAIGAQFYERYGDAQAFAMNAVFQHDNIALKTKALNDYVRLYGIYDLILVVDSKGKFVASNTLSPRGETLKTESMRNENFPAEAWFQAVSNRKFTDDAAKNMTGTYFDDVAFDRVVSGAYGNTAFTTGFAAPILGTDGVAIGYICNRANMSWIENEVANLYAGIRTSGLKSTDITILNKRGDVIVDFDGARMTSDKIVFERDPNVLLKLNLVERGVDSAKSAVEGRAGHTFDIHARKKIEQLSTFTPIDSKKFIRGIGWSLLVRDDKKEVFAALAGMKTFFYVSFAICMALAMGFSSWFAARISNQIGIVISNMRSQSTASKGLAEALAESASDLASSSTEQAAAVQETVASMAQMTSMVAQTSSNAGESQNLAHNVTDKTKNGAKVMEKLEQSMDAIRTSSSQLKSISDIIREISTKTIVIDDIVFKTQLLSFNASIEAARAGSNGKGFAVVAEEVGNLAQMSGAAAKEIQTMLFDSQQQVSQILEVIRQRISEGQSVSAEATSTFAEIAQDIDAIRLSVQGIAQASREQEAGIKQTSIAMQQLDETTQRNSTGAQKSQKLSLKVQKQSDQMNASVQDLSVLTYGDNSATPDSTGLTLTNREPLESAGSMPRTASLKPRALMDRIVSKERKRSEKQTNVDKISADDPSYTETL